MDRESKNGPVSRDGTVVVVVGVGQFSVPGKSTSNFTVRSGLVRQTSAVMRAPVPRTPFRLILGFREKQLCFSLKLVIGNILVRDTVLPLNLGITVS